MKQDETLRVSEDDRRQLENLNNELEEVASKNQALEVDLCGWYRSSKPILERALPIIRRVAGQRVAAALEVLMRIADTFCAA